MASRFHKKRRTAKRGFAIAARLEARAKHPLCPDDPAWLLKHAEQTCVVASRRQKSHERRLDDRRKEEAHRQRQGSDA